MSLCLVAGLAFSMPDAALGPSSGAMGGLFTKQADIPLGEKTSRFDYESPDPNSGRLFISKMGSGKLLVPQ